LIAGLLVKTATAPLFHAKFWDVPLGLDCRLMGSKELRHNANYLCNYFQSNQSYMTVQTDRQTDKISACFELWFLLKNSENN